MSELTERVLVVVAVIICCVATILIGPPVGTRKRKTQQKQQTDDDRIDKWAPMPRTIYPEGTWRPMSQMSNICTPDHIQRMLDEEHITVTKRVTVGSLNGTSDTNMVTVYMRKWPVFGISDHIAVMLYGKISLGTNIVSVGMYKDGMWTEADHNEGALLTKHEETQ
jgi:hypothetical protein